MEEKLGNQINILSSHYIRRLLAIGKPFVLRINGDSMEPYLFRGDHVMVEPASNSYKEQDLVLIDWGDQFVVHRLVDSQKMRTKGDNLCDFDPPGLPIVACCKRCSGKNNETENSYR